MKTSNLFAAILLSMVFPLFVSAQHNHGHASQEKYKSDKMSQMMDKPTFEQSVEGYRLQVWLITQDEHKKMMSSGMKDSSRHEMEGHGMTEEEMSGMVVKGMKSDRDGKEQKGMMGAMLSGTHHIMLILTDEKASKPPEKASAEVEVLSPSKKSETTKLVEMMNHFGGGIKLEGKGLYTLTVRWKVGDNEYKTTFTYQNY